MTSHRMVSCLLGLLILPLALLAAPAPPTTLPATFPAIDSQHVVVRPKPIDDVLDNPHMGITTFQRFNNQPLNEAGNWSEEGPLAAADDLPAQPANFPNTSVSYCRWFWSTLESEQGKVKWDIIDSALVEARKHHQTLAIRMMPYDDGHPLPKWYQDSDAKRANKPTDEDGKIWQPDFADPLYMKYWGALVAEAGRRYDGHPFLDSVDISSVGYWGEGWSAYMVDFQYQKALIDIYLKAFTRTPLLMNFDMPEALTYGCAHGAGWRLDCLGDLRTDSVDPLFPNEMLDVYPEQVVQTGIVDAWKHAPVSLETCWTPIHWKEQNWDVDYSLAQALRWHVTTVNVKSTQIPPEWKGKFDDFQKKMGYRFQLRRLEYPRQATAGTMMPIHMWWLNAGVAPIYFQYTLAIQLSSDTDSTTVEFPTDIRQWLPGDAVVDTTMYVPDSLKPGTYTLKVGLLDPRTHKPAIQLAIEGRDAEGWYPMGVLRVN